MESHAPVATTCKHEESGRANAVHRAFNSTTHVCPFFHLILAFSYFCFFTFFYASLGHRGRCGVSMSTEQLTGLSPGCPKTLLRCPRQAVTSSGAVLAAGLAMTGAVLHLRAGCCGGHQPCVAVERLECGSYNRGTAF